MSQNNMVGVFTRLFTIIFTNKHTLQKPAKRNQPTRGIPQNIGIYIQAHLILLLVHMLMVDLSLFSIQYFTIHGLFYKHSLTVSFP